MDLGTPESIGLLLVGIGILVVCSDLLVDGSVWAARRLGVPTFVVGLTIIAYGTSLPEAVVSILAGLQGASDFAVGNIVGSNIANIGLVLGLTALVCAIQVEKTGTLFSRELPWLLGVTLAVLAIVFMNALEGHPVQRMLVGVAFLGLSLLYTAQALKLNPADFGRKVMRKWFARSPKGLEMRDGEFSVPPAQVAPVDVESLDESPSDESLDAEADDDSLDEEPAGWGKICLYLLGGFIGLVLGAELMVIGGKNIATQLGISERIIALTIVAIGTSLPELAASVAAARKGHPELAVGNVVGSCLFNLSFVLGLAAIAAPITVDVEAMKWDFLLMMALTVLMFALLWSGRNLSRVEGGLLLGIYLAFMGWVSVQAFTTAGTAEDKGEPPAAEVSLLYQPVDGSTPDARPAQSSVSSPTRLL